MLEWCLLSFDFLNHSLIIVQVVWKATFELMVILLTQFSTLWDDRYLQNKFEILSNNTIDVDINYDLLFFIVLEAK